jgi:hypothetical protein
VAHLPMHGEKPLVRRYKDVSTRCFFMA